VAATVAVALVFLCTVPSSSDGSDRLRVGLKVGWPWSWISHDGPWGQQDSDTDTRIFSGGIVLELPFRDSATLAVVSGVTYVVKSGDTYNGAVKQVTPTEMLTLDWTCYYFAVPLMLKHSFTPGRLSPYIAGGAEIGIPVKAEYMSCSYRDERVQGLCDSRNVTDDMRVIEFSLAAAGGLDFPIGGSLSGFVEVAYVHGLNDVWKDDLEEVRYRTLTVSGGLMY
jgi:hypothetical protein